MRRNIIKCVFGILLISTVSCEDFLEEKPLKSILVPSTLEDARTLLDYFPGLNANTLATFVIADDWEISSQKWNTLDPWIQNAYQWQTAVYQPSERSSDYMNIHNKIFYANNIESILDKLEDQSSKEFFYLKGEAKALRGRALFELAMLFLPGPKSQLKDQIKIPINMSPDVNAPLVMLSITEMLELIKDNLSQAFEYLPEKQLYMTRPDKASAKAFLARVYLYEEKWQEAFQAASYVVEYSDGLLNYRDLEPTLAYPFKLFNVETVFYGVTSSFSVTASPESFVNGEVYELYGDNDYRKELFFNLDKNGDPLFRGSLTGTWDLFTGISLPEMYLTAAESAVRAGNVGAGIAFLNELRMNRYADFEPWDSLTKEEALREVLTERQREQVFRGTRWMDMKRFWYLEPGTLSSRQINNELFSLSTEEQLFWEIPPFEIELQGR